MKYNAFQNKEIYLDRDAECKKNGILARVKGKANSSKIVFSFVFVLFAFLLFSSPQAAYAYGGEDGEEDYVLDFEESIDSKGIQSSFDWCAFVPDAEIINDNIIMKYYCKANGISTDSFKSEDSDYKSIALGKYVGTSTTNFSELNLKKDDEYKWALKRIDTLTDEEGNKSEADAEYSVGQTASSLTLKEAAFKYYIPGLNSEQNLAIYKYMVNFMYNQYDLPDVYRIYMPSIHLKSYAQMERTQL